LNSNVQTEDFAMPMSVGEAWESMTAPGGEARRFNKEFYSDQLENADCPIPARRPGKCIAIAFRKRDSAIAF
jgi:hypothetical protein